MRCTLVCTCLLVCVASGAAARPTADPLAGYYGRGMPRYPGVTEVPAGAASRVGGTDVRMSFFSTEDEPARVARFYANAWRQRHCFVREDVTHQGGVVSAVAAESSTVSQGLILVEGGRTLVFPSASRAPLRAMQTGQEPPPVPLFPGSRSVITLGSRESQMRARAHLSLNDGGLAANVLHYTRELRAAGYALETKKDQPLSPDHRILLFRKEGREVTVNLTALGPKQVRVHLMEIGQ